MLDPDWKAFCRDYVDACEVVPQRGFESLTHASRTNWLNRVAPLELQIQRTPC